MICNDCGADLVPELEWHPVNRPGVILVRRCAVCGSENLRCEITTDEPDTVETEPVTKPRRRRARKDA